LSTPAREIVEVWIVDRTQRLPTTLPVELAQRQVAARFIRRDGDFTLTGGVGADLPTAVLFSEVASPDAHLVSGYLMGLALNKVDPLRTLPVAEAMARARASLLWWGWHLPIAPLSWPVKLRALASSSAPRLAHEIAFAARKHLSARRNAAPSAPV
jgi:hypothetical protein